jgi:hypothetical protein
VLIYKPSGGDTAAARISPKRVTQWRQPVSSASTTRLSSPWGLGYIRSILWVTSSSKTH